jgi:serine/threonine-protein kinase
MSPEQIRGDALDERADIYSFGATLYEMLTLRPPFRAATPKELLNKHLLEKPITPQYYNAEITDEFGFLILRMLSKKKDDRPKHFTEFMTKLKNTRIYKGETLTRTGE